MAFGLFFGFVEVLLDFADKLVTVELDLIELIVCDVALFFFGLPPKLLPFTFKSTLVYR